MAALPVVNAQTEIARLYDTNAWIPYNKGNEKGYRFTFKQISAEHGKEIEAWFKSKKIEVIVEREFDGDADSFFRAYFDYVFLNESQFALISAGKKEEVLFQQNMENMADSLAKTQITDAPVTMDM